MFLLYAGLSDTASTALFGMVTKKTMIVTLAVPLLVACAAMILSARYTPSDKHWAYGTAGALLGFWLSA